jgi:hypothetical protein
MNTDVTELVSVLEEEIAVGEELHRNLEAQKTAIVAWDIVNLLEQIDAKEPWLRSLGQLEERRSLVLRRIAPADVPITLRQIIANLPQEGSDRAFLDRLGERTRKVFTRLDAEERDLRELMQSLLGHIQDALSSLTEPLPVYSESGITPPARALSGLLHGKA